MRSVIVHESYVEVSSVSSHEGLLNIEVPLLASRNLDFTNVTWNYTTAPQTSLNNRAIAYSRGKLLGGIKSAGETYRRIA